MVVTATAIVVREARDVRVGVAAAVTAEAAKARATCNPLALILERGCPHPRSLFLRPRCGSKLPQSESGSKLPQSEIEDQRKNGP